MSEIIQFPRWQVLEPWWPQPWEINVVFWNHYVEVDDQAESKWPLLRQIVRYRRQEVWNYLAVTRPERDRRITESMYLSGYGPGACV
jgi:hypothetical protein